VSDVARHLQTASPAAWGQCVVGSLPAKPQCVVRHERSQVVAASQVAWQLAGAFDAHVDAMQSQ